jgi:hypothetical protein
LPFISCSLAIFGTVPALETREYAGPGSVIAIRHQFPRMSAKFARRRPR